MNGFLFIFSGKNGMEVEEDLLPRSYSQRILAMIHRVDIGVA